MQDRKNDIVQAATQLFAAGGYEGVSVRDICALAHVSVAMVNYHFRNKEGLYRECVERLFRKGGEALVSGAADVKDAKSWRAAVTDWVQRFSSVMRAETGDAALAGGIYRQEVIHPSAMHDFILREYVTPVRDSLVKLLKMAELNEQQAFLWASTIWSELSAHAIADASWREAFRPADVNPTKWTDSFIEFVSSRIFKDLKYHA